MIKRLLHSHPFYVVECENYSLCFCLLCCNQGGCCECLGACACACMCVCQVWSLQNWSDSLLFAGGSPASVGTVCEAELHMKPPTLVHMWTPSYSASYPRGHLGGESFSRSEFDIPLMMVETQYNIYIYIFLWNLIFTYIVQTNYSYSNYSLHVLCQSGDPKIVVKNFLFFSSNLDASIHFISAFDRIAF